jgi:hypothetical protein
MVKGRDPISSFCIVRLSWVACIHWWVLLALVAIKVALGNYQWLDGSSSYIWSGILYNGFDSGREIARDFLEWG